MSDAFEDEDFVSRTQKKQVAEDAQDLGERLLTLSNKQLKSLDLPENLYDAVVAANNIKAHGGLKRQLQFIGKLMRHIEIDDIVAYFDELDNKHYATNAKFKNMEIWRDRLIREGNDGIQKFQEERPNADVQKLRQLVRNANNKKNEKLALRSKRAIFQYIKEVITNASES